MCAGAPERACARASAHPQNPAYATMKVCTEQFGLRPDLHVPELPNVEMSAGVASRPAKEDVARRLHEPVAAHDPLPVIRVRALAGVRLQDRGSRLLDLEEQGIFFAGHQQRNRAEGGLSVLAPSPG